MKIEESREQLRLLSDTVNAMSATVEAQSAQIMREDGGIVGMGAEAKVFEEKIIALTGEINKLAQDVARSVDVRSNLIEEYNSAKYNH